MVSAGMGGMGHRIGKKVVGDDETIQFPQDPHSGTGAPGGNIRADSCNGKIFSDLKPQLFKVG